jgi:hypothetical protein
LAGIDRFLGGCLPFVGRISGDGLADGFGRDTERFPVSLGIRLQIHSTPLQTSLRQRGQNHAHSATVHATKAKMKITTVTSMNTMRRTTISTLGSPRMGMMTKIDMRDRMPKKDKGMKLRQLPNHLPKLMK